MLFRFSLLLFLEVKSLCELLELPAVLEYALLLYTVKQIELLSMSSLSVSLKYQYINVSFSQLISFAYYRRMRPMSLVLLLPLRVISVWIKSLTFVVGLVHKFVDFRQVISLASFFFYFHF